MTSVDSYIWGEDVSFCKADDLLLHECADFLDPDDPDDAALAEALTEEANAILYILSARTIGIRTETVRPGFTVDDPRCPSRVEEIPLQWPVRTVDEVKIDGAVVTDWYVLDDRLLMRSRDANGRRQGWPSRQRLDLPDTEPGTFSITYSWGIEVPPFARRAALELACAFAEEHKRGSCDRLPENVSSVQRPGVSYSLNERAQALRDGVTPDTFPAVVRFLSLVNPSSELMPSSAVSPDLIPLNRITHLPS